MVKNRFFFFLNLNFVLSPCESQLLNHSLKNKITMDEKLKKIKGSAVVDGEGGFVFTPYRTLPPDEKGLKCIFAFQNATLWCGKRAYMFRFRCDKSRIPPLTAIVATLMRAYAYMMKDVEAGKKYTNRNEKANGHDF